MDLKLCSSCSEDKNFSFNIFFLTPHFVILSIFVWYKHPKNFLFVFFGKKIIIAFLFF